MKIYTGSNAFGELFSQYTITAGRRWGICQSKKLFGMTGLFFKTVCGKFFFQPDSDISWDIFEVKEEDIYVDGYSYPI